MESADKVHLKRSFLIEIAAASYPWWTAINFDWQDLDQDWQSETDKELLSYNGFYYKILNI